MGKGNLEGPVEPFTELSQNFPYNAGSFSKTSRLNVASKKTPER